MNKTAVLACSCLESEVIEAQKCSGTNYEIVLFDSGLHINPKVLRKEIEKQLDILKKQGIDTVLLGMGLCGNSLHGIKVPLRLIVPKVDDCITLLLHTDNKSYLNLKLTGHFYMTKGMVELTVDKGNDTGMNYDKMIEKYGEEKSRKIIKMMYENYVSFDMIDTGVYPLEDIYQKSKERADLVGCSLNTVTGSNIILENMFSGNWETQFLVFEAEQTISMYDFFNKNVEEAG